MKSKFRKLFWMRIAMGFLIFSAVLYYFLDSLFRNTIDIKLLFAFLALVFLMYMSAGLFKIYTLTISENGIELQHLLWRDKNSIPFEAISSLEYDKVRYRNSRGYVSDGHKMCYIKLKNGKRFMISPDTFENYDQLILSIKQYLNELD